MLVFLNGKFVPAEKAVISVFDRGFLYGDGVFEAIRVFNGKPFRWQDHIERLEAGAEFLKIKLKYSCNELRAIADKLILENAMPDSVLRIVLSRGIGTPGYSPKDARQSTLVMSLRPAPKPKAPPRRNLITSSFRVLANDPLSGFKTSNKLLQVLARAEADAAGALEALLLNSDGFVAEGTSSNVFWIKRGGIFTPPLSSGILPGVTRAVVFEIAAQLKMPVHEKNIRPKDLERVDGMFLSLSSWGIVEVSALDGREVKRSRVTGRIRSAYFKILGGGGVNRES